ncbi:unnamed protein product [Cyclocybe aegerita]|uniref:Uncharacterized protein n=1 Tax=Cyclocybe aegerita TaxID=1973307 RepID=A0A8S0VZX5_CYCAE|nr:unnamed protein product [Cyclocybe aegerita]
MRRRANTNTTSALPPRPASKFVPASVYSHVSTYRSSQLELQLYSPSLKVHDDGRGPVAVFSGHDQVGGRVCLDADAYHTGRLSISIEGAFSYRVTKPYEDPWAPTSDPQKHIFLSSMTSISVSNSEASSPRSVFREAFVRRRPSVSAISFVSSSTERSHSFTFSLPQSVRPGEEMPPSFLSTKDPSEPDYFDITYKIIVDWEPQDPFDTPSHLEIPFLMQPDDFQCVDASTTASGSWLEMPLKADRPIPVRCAMTLPTSVTFSRSSSIPYFVVFTTTPRSPEMAKEIAADATISVSLIRQLNINDHASLPPTPPLTPTSEESEPSALKPPTRLLRRVAKSHPRFRDFPRPRRISEGAVPFTRDKPLPEIPLSPMLTTFSDMRTVSNDMCIGFPKRPRQQCDTNKSHPSLETIAALPDGLHKTRIPLDMDLLPCIDWGGISVKYYLDVSVLIGADDFRARVPIRIF